MADNNPIPLKPKKVPDDAKDIESLWLDERLGDALVDVHFHSIPVSKPKDFFRVCPDKAYRRPADIYTHKVEGQVEQTEYLIDRPMRGRFDEAQRCTLVTVVYRDGSPRLWPLKVPGEDGKDNDAWKSARAAARTAMGKWVKLVWKGGRYQTRDALPGYAPEPDWSKLPAWEELVRLGFGEHNIIRSDDHFIAQALLGGPPQPDDDDDDLS
jgi:hypothetical protein